MNNKIHLEIHPKIHLKIHPRNRQRVAPKMGEKNPPKKSPRNRRKSIPRPSPQPLTPGARSPFAAPLAVSPCPWPAVPPHRHCPPRRRRRAGNQTHDPPPHARRTHTSPKPDDLADRKSLLTHIIKNTTYSAYTITPPYHTNAIHIPTIKNSPGASADIFEVKIDARKMSLTGYPQQVNKAVPHRQQKKRTRWI